jgi:hypothetical protein
MTDDRSIAREVQALLLSAHPEREDINLAKEPGQGRPTCVVE